MGRHKKNCECEKCKPKVETNSEQQADIAQADSEHEMPVAEQN